MILLGISGKIGCGKTTLAQMLIEQAPIEVSVRLSFGDNIKRECAAYFGFPVEWCHSQEGKEKKFSMGYPGGDLDASPLELTVREALQWYGTDYRRAHDPEYWLKAMRVQIDRYSERYADTDPLIVIDDVRFPDEAELVRSLGGSLVRLDPFEGWTPGSHAEHITETALDDWQGWALRAAPRLGGLADIAAQVLELVGVAS